MEIGYVLLLSICCLIVGWLFGVYASSKKTQTKEPVQFTGDMKHRLQLLFDSYSDDSIDRFIQSLDVTTETLSLHISIGKHFRIQGEVEKAILVHQNLMSHPELSSKSSEYVIYELAKDYKAAGLFDRAQALLQQLKSSKQFSVKSLKLLLQIHEAEKDWQAALDEASMLDLKRHKDIALRVSQYHCELAEQYLKSGLVREAVGHFKQGLNVYKGCFRANIGLAKIYLNNEEYSHTIQQIKQAISIAPENIKDVLPLLLQVTKSTHSFENHQDYLIRLLQETAQTPIVLAIIESMLVSGEKSKASAFLKQHLTEYPSITALECFYSLDDLTRYPSEDILSLTANVLQAVYQENSHYQCLSCGFSGSQLHWLCPSCKNWQTIKPLVDYENRLE